MTRTRRLAVLWIIFLLVLLPSVFLWMLLGTSMGLRYVLKQAAGALPAGQVTYTSVDGSLWRGARIQGLRVRSDDFDLVLDRLALDVELGALLRREARVTEVELRGLVLTLPEGDADAQAAEPFPLRLPALDLPLSVHVARLHIDGLQISAGTATLADIKSVDARFAIDGGVIDISHLQVVEPRATVRLDGSVDTRRQYLTALQIDLQPPDPEWATTLTVAGDTHSLRLTTEGSAALPLAATVHAQNLDRRQPTWRLDLRGEGVDPSPWIEAWTLGAVDIDLGGDGSLDQQSVGGRIVVQGREIEIDALELRWSAGRVELVRLDVIEGTQTLQARGHLLLASPLSARLEADFTQIGWPVQAPRATASGRLELHGGVDAWTLELDSEVTVDAARSEIMVRGAGDAEGFDIARMEAVTDLGRLQAAGQVQWSDGFGWRLQADAQRFDPSRIGLPVAAMIDAKLVSEGIWSDAGPRGNLVLSDLSGAIGEAPLSGRAAFEAESLQRWQAEADLLFGEGRLALRGSARDGIIDALLEMVDFDLAVLGLPLAAHADGNVRVAGSVDAPRIGLDVILGRVRMDALTAETLQIAGSVNAAREVDLQLDASNMAYQDLHFDSLDATLAGSVGEHALELRMSGAPASVDLGASGGLTDGQWRGRIGRLALEVEHAGRWSLEDPVALALAADAVVVERACMAGERSGRLCAEALLPADGDAAIIMDLDALSLALFAPFLFPDGFRRLDGIIEGRAAARRVQGLWNADFDFAVPALTLYLDPAGASDNALRFDDIALDGVYAGDGARAQIRARVGEDGRLAGTLAATPLQETWALDARVELGMDAAGLETLLPGLEGVRGRIDGNATVGGTLAEPQPDARLAVTGLALDVVAAGIRLSEGTLNLRAAAGQRLALTGRIRSGDGHLQWDGYYDLATRSADLSLSGENFEAVDLPQARVGISPDLSLQYGGGAARLTGSVAVPSALIDLSRLESADRPSADVVIVESGMDPEPDSGLPLTARVVVNLGEDVRLRGFGLDGRLRGSLTVRETPGQAPTGQGGIDVSGRFAAYGRELEIQRGRLLFNGALDNPRLDIRAERAIEEVTVGVQVTGEAVSPQLALFSRPQMSQSDALSYLVVGRPMSAVRSGDGELLTDAATALGTAGGDLLARQLGARTGLDLGVEASAELGTALTVGKYLSPRLYLGYGVSLLGTGQVVMLRYMISDAWSVEVESGAEGKAALNYRLER